MNHHNLSPPKNIAYLIEPYQPPLILLSKHMNNKIISRHIKLAHRRWVYYKKIKHIRPNKDRIRNVEITCKTTNKNKKGVQYTGKKYSKHIGRSNLLKDSNELSNLADCMKKMTWHSLHNISDKQSLKNTRF